MRDGNSKKSKVSWPKTLVKKWFNFRSKAENFHADGIIYGGSDEEWRNSISERDACTLSKSQTEKSNERNSGRRCKIDLDTSQIMDIQNYRIFVATWNVAGKSPPGWLNLEEWLHTSSPADIYVLGFQEIVPLNAGNVLGSEDNGPARKWLALIHKTLRSHPGSTGGHQTPSPVPCPVVELDDNSAGLNREKAYSFSNRLSFQSLSHSMRMHDDEISKPHTSFDRRFSVCDRVIYGNRPSDYYDPNLKRDCYSDEENGQSEEYSTVSYSGSISMDRDRQAEQSRYCLIASKQMVGIFLTIWIKSDLRDDVRNLKVSCVSRGLMGYLGNKGSISISMSLHQTSFCFVCSHLSSGEKDGDEQRRNSDVMEILRKTRFPRVHDMGDENSPQTILEHDRIIWLGDLNYRISLSKPYAKALVEMHNWRALLENDQLRMEQRYGRVFTGWKEGRIYFPPTYKYSNNSDRYAGENTRPKEKQRTPAWCDRILWYGRGLQQLSYVRGESRFSDHRPVCSIFSAEVECINRARMKKSLSYSSSRIEVEELLPYSNEYGRIYFSEPSFKHFHVGS
ncbi:type I inositol polyphosphate 5-phosphatase 4-like [Primulina eburnea]|uniref:type I inositol polyphosphate 5-phosphatase 4-like n=1 Tax=Primulina eburnea TaxID=1245227 RepID=UPI003C6C30FA